MEDVEWKCDELVKQTAIIAEKYPKDASALVKAVDDFVLAIQVPRLSYLCARDIKGVNFKAHEQIVLDSKDDEYNTNFAKLEGADVLAHEKVVIDNKNPLNNYVFARDVEGADIMAHWNVVRNGHIYSVISDFSLLIRAKARGEKPINGDNAEYWEHGLARALRGEPDAMHSIENEQTSEEGEPKTAEGHGKEK